MVCDYRYINTALRAKAGAMINSWDMLREAAESAIKSLLDAYSGFCHLVLGRALQNLLTIATSMGLLRWKTLPFGSKNAPPEFQAAVNAVFKELIPEYVRIFVDDLCARTGQWRQGLEALRDDALVAEHLALLDRVGSIAIREGLMFKFPKRSSCGTLLRWSALRAAGGRSR